MHLHGNNQQLGLLLCCTRPYAQTYTHIPRIPPQHNAAREIHTFLLFVRLVPHSQCIQKRDLSTRANPFNPLEKRKNTDRGDPTLPLQTLVIGQTRTHLNAAQTSQQATFVHICCVCTPTGAARFVLNKYHYTQYWRVATHNAPAVTRTL